MLGLLSCPENSSGHFFTHNWSRKQIFALKPIAEEYGIRLAQSDPGYSHNGHMYYLIFETFTQRQNFIAFMKSKNISTPFHYVPLHSAPAGLKHARTPHDMEVTDKISETLVRLPMFYSFKKQDKVIESVKAGIKAVSC